jgi:hypothetical protein
MSRLAALFNLESFRSSVHALLVIDDAALAKLRAQSLAEEEYNALPDDESEDELTRRAFRLLYETAMRPDSGLDGELHEIFPDDSAAVDRLINAIASTPEERERLDGIEERDGYLPILVDHRFALDVRVVKTRDDEQVAVPFVSSRMRFDASLVVGSNSTVFQINLMDIDRLIEELREIREDAQKLQGSIKVTIPEWANGLPR